MPRKKSDPKKGYGWSIRVSDKTHKKLKQLATKTKTFSYAQTFEDIVKYIQAHEKEFLESLHT